MEWEKVNKKLRKEFKFDDFNASLEFVNKVGKIAEEIDHHPDILIHDYNQVKIETTTHEKGEVTDKDHDLAEKIDDLM